MTTNQANKLKADKSHVRFANGKYKVASVFKEFGALFIEIYDEPPSQHVDRLNAANVEFVKEWV